MTKTPKLTDLDLVLLSGAAQRDDGMVLPPPETVRARGKTLEKALAKLLHLGLVAECRADTPDQAWRHEDEGVIALRITAAGRGVLGLDASSVDSVGPAEDHTDGIIQAPATDLAACPALAGIRPGTKQARLVALLQRAKGAALEELCTALGWQAHTVRAAITGLRKKGYVITSTKGGNGKTVYRATKPVTAADDAA